MTTCDRTKGKKNSDFTSRIPGSCWLRKSLSPLRQLARAKENQPVNVISKRRPKLLVLKKLLVVGQTNELLVDSYPVPFKQTEPKGLKDWDHHINGEDDRRRRDEEPRRKIMTADSAPPSSAEQLPPGWSRFANSRNLRRLEKALRTAGALFGLHSLPTYCAVFFLEYSLSDLIEPFQNLVDPVWKRHEFLKAFHALGRHFRIRVAIIVLRRLGILQKFDALLGKGDPQAAWRSRLQGKDASPTAICS